MRKLVKGNEAVVLGALNAGCDAYFGYPITPASEIAELTALHFLQLGKIFIQAECEVASVNMLYGGSSAGMRVMTSSSGPGISLMQEGISYMACAELPAVFVDIMRVGPGLGNIGPEQADYFQTVKGGGHGSYHVIVLTPNSAREMYEMTIRAFDLADKWRSPVFVLADAILGQMMEAIDFEDLGIKKPAKPWAVDSTKATNENLITSIYMEADVMEKYVLNLDKKYKQIEAEEAEAEFYLTDDAEILLTGFGIISRILHETVDQLRKSGIRAGLMRPKTIWPFPTKQYQEEFNKTKAPVLVVELSTGQYIEDVRLTLPRAEVSFLGRLGGNLPSSEEIIAKVKSILKKD